MNTPPTDTRLEIGPLEAARRQESGVPLFDVRPPGDQALGRPTGARHLDPETADESLAAAGLNGDQELIVCCATGRRSLATVQRLRAAGFHRAYTVAGGFAAWQANGLPADYPATLGREGVERYARHLSLPEVGLDGQLRLRRASVLVVGAGGLGSPAALYLAAAGVGRLGIVDDDRVERSNLQRQLLHTDAAVGQAKADSALERLSALNPDVELVPMAERMTARNAERLVSGWDLVLDGSDNLPTRYLLNAVCVARGIPLVFGGVTGFQGQVAVFHPNAGDQRPCYACAFPLERARADVADCNVAGILGVLPGLIGVLQATEALKLLLGLGQALDDRLLLIDALGMEFRQLRLHARPDCPVCSPGAGPLVLQDIETACAQAVE